GRAAGRPARAARACVADRAARPRLRAHGARRGPRGAPHRPLRPAQPRATRHDAHGARRGRPARRHRDHRARVRPARHGPAAARRDRHDRPADHRRRHALQRAARDPRKSRRRSRRPPARSPARDDEEEPSPHPTESEHTMIRGRTRRLVIAPAILAVGAIAFTACSASDSGSEEGSADATGGTLTIYTAAEEVSFDPASSQNLAITTLGLNARRLTAWSTDPNAPTEVVPDLATDTGTASDDGKT